LCRQLKVKQPEKYVAAAVASYHDTKTSIQPFPKIPLLLLHLKEKGFRIYAATSGNSVKQWDKLIRLRVSLYFDGVFVTPNEKDSKFYKKILSELGTKAENCIMIGDREEVDITPAKLVGMRTIRVLAGKYAASQDSNADFVAKNPSDLVSIFQKLI
jgi:FMN phosphatase YigB (HAD superfamily)